MLRKAHRPLHLRRTERRSSASYSRATLRPRPEARAAARRIAGPCDDLCGRADRPSPALVLGKEKRVGERLRLARGREGRRPAEGPVPARPEGLRVRALRAGREQGRARDVLNSDPVLHNVHATTVKGDALFNMAIPVKGQTLHARRSTTAGVVRMKCDVHAWMNAWLFVADIAVRGRDGQGGPLRVSAASRPARTASTRGTSSSGRRSSPSRCPRAASRKPT